MIKLVIDPGHGGEDPGAVGNGLKEKDINLDLGKRVAGKLSSYNVDVTLTRSSDLDISLEDRSNIANNLEADYFCSFHINAGGGTGFESYIYTNAADDTENLRNVLHDIIAGYYKKAGLPDRGKKRANFAVLRDTDMPAVLLENLFIDNPADAGKLKDISFLEGLAGSIAGGLVAALGIPLKPSPVPTQPPTPSPTPAPTPVPTNPPVPPWDPAGEIAKLKADGLIKSDHQPDDPVTWGELATVINRMRGK